jgi:(1->4)-alpha-D-glucan 1-alpha-D-glucosylmutase
VAMAGIVDRWESSGSPVRIPRATYRLQFHAGFTLRDATVLVPYLGALGVSDVYASPLAEARRGSMHGYDVCDPTRLNPVLGTEGDFEAFTEALKQAGMGLILDIVPNHLGTGDPANRWWMDLLEHGRASPFAVCFDMDWESPEVGPGGRVLLPVLGDRFGGVLEAGEFEVHLDPAGFMVGYHEHRFPLCPGSLGPLLELWRQAILAGADSAGRLMAAEQLTREWGELCGGDPADEEWRGRWTSWKAACASAIGREPAMSRAWELVRTTAGGGSGSDARAAWFESLLERQHYRLAWWRYGAEALNYRRFFDITHLVGLRVEDAGVFRRSHALVRRWWSEGRVQGLRIDHPDGLWDPAEYFRRLQDLAPGEGAARGGDGRGRRLYVVVEKILSPGELLPEDWAVHGTTGYDFLNDVNGVLVDTGNSDEFDRVYRGFVGEGRAFADEVYANKRAILEGSLAAEVERLSRRARDWLGRTRRGRDYSARQIRRVVVGLTAAFPVYRTYVDSRTRELGGVQRAWVEAAAGEVARREVGLPGGLVRLFEEVLCLSWPKPGEAEALAAREWVMQFQQLTGPAMAKGLEDTTFYTHVRLLSLNEVGGHPGRFGLSPAEFHAANGRRREHWPQAMLATATHDTKRGEDLRARLNVLTEMPGEWGEALAEFRAANGIHRTKVRGEWAPAPADEYLLYQTLAGMGVGRSEDMRDGPGLVERVWEYMQKAIREAKRHTSWTDPDTDYEGAVERFVRRVLDPDSSGVFCRRMSLLGGRLAAFGRMNSLAQTLLKLTAPGVPDLYQGTEFWDLSLVDPDNRRPVDFEARRGALDQLGRLERAPVASRGGAVAELLASGDGSMAKLWLIRQVLRARRARPALWAEGSYEAISASGVRAGNVIAYARRWGSEWMLVVVPRLPLGLMRGREGVPVGAGVWGDTGLACPGWLAAGGGVDVLTGAGMPRVRGGGCLVAELLSLFPVALVVGVHR